MFATANHRFTVKDYYRMAETGVLRPDARVELLDGQIIDMSPIGPFHGSIVKRLIDLFSRFASERWLVVAQDPLRLDDRSEPQPDLMLVKRSPDYMPPIIPGQKMFSCSSKFPILLWNLIVPKSFPHTVAPVLMKSGS